MLDNRALNRSLMARQLLAERQTMPVAGALTHLVGLQAQEPLEPYVGLWSRLAAFDPASLVAELESRRAVRTLLMRRTLHLVTARDCLSLRALHQPMLEARMRAVLSRGLAGVDPAELAAAGRPLFEREPSPLSEVGRAVGERWPHAAARDLGDALSSLVQLVQVPPRGLWGRSGPARNTTIEAWLGEPPAAASESTAEDLVLRYLAAFGPAASADVRAWSGLSGMREVLQRLRPRLRTFRDGRGRELFDVPGAPLPDPDTPVPPRFLPAFDNAVLGFDDRSRIIDDEFKPLSVAGARFLLIDGRVAGVWTIDPAGRSAQPSLPSRPTPLAPPAAASSPLPPPAAGPSSPPPPPTADPSSPPPSPTARPASSAAPGTLRITLLTRPPQAEVDAAVAEGERLLAWHSGPGKVTVDFRAS